MDNRCAISGIVMRPLVIGTPEEAKAVVNGRRVRVRTVDLVTCPVATAPARLRSNYGCACLLVVG